MVLVLSFLFLVIGALALIPLRINNGYKLIFITIGVILFLIAAFRVIGVDRDYLNYVKFFNDYKNLTIFKVEPSFIFVSYLVKRYLFNKVIFVFVIYALLAVSLKLYAIKQLSEFWLLSLLVYFSYSFILQDMTQIRAGVAVAFLLLSIKPLYERNLSLFLLFASMASLFHYSAIIIFPLWFLNPKNINSSLYMSFIFITFVLSRLNINFSNIIELMPIDIIHNKFLAYKYQQGGVLNVLNAWQLMRCFLSFLFLWKADEITQINKYGFLLIKIYVSSTCALFLFSDLPVFAYRISDMFAIVDIITLPFLLYFVKPKFLARGLVIFISFTYFFLNLFFNKIII